MIELTFEGRIEIEEKRSIKQRQKERESERKRKRKRQKQQQRHEQALPGIPPSPVVGLTVGR
jgi:hypothetical protein